MLELLSDGSNCLPVLFMKIFVEQRNETRPSTLISHSIGKITGALGLKSSITFIISRTFESHLKGIAQHTVFRP